MKLMNKIIVPVTASALLLGACGSNELNRRITHLFLLKLVMLKLLT